MKQRVLIIIPAYNEEKTIANVLLKLRRMVPDFDRVVVNDGSKDATGNIVAELGEKQLRLVSNLGYGRALQTGMRYALIRGYDIVVTFDGDGQHRPEDVPQVVQALRENDADMVIGSRFCNGHSYTTPISRRLGQLLFSHLTRLLIGRRIYDTSSGFKALRKTACEAIMNSTFMDFHLETIVQLSILNCKIIEVPITVEERAFGHSMHSLVSIFHYPLKTLLLTLATAVDAFLVRRTR